jgi:hypothetical protein
VIKENGRETHFIRLFCVRSNPVPPSTATKNIPIQLCPITMYTSILIIFLSLPDKKRTSRGQMGIVRSEIFCYGKFCSSSTFGHTHTRKYILTSGVARNTITKIIKSTIVIVDASLSSDPVVYFLETFSVFTLTRVGFRYCWFLHDSR